MTSFVHAHRAQYSGLDPMVLERIAGEFFLSRFKVSLAEEYGSAMVDLALRHFAYREIEVRDSNGESVLLSSVLGTHSLREVTRARFVTEYPDFEEYERIMATITLDQPVRLENADPSVFAAALASSLTHVSVGFWDYSQSGASTRTVSWMEAAEFLDRMSPLLKSR